MNAAQLARSSCRALKLAAVFVGPTLELILKRPATRQKRAEWLHRFCAQAVRRMGIAVRQQGTFPEQGVVIANHLGYLDIVALAALHRCVFVSKQEVRDWPLLGWMTTLAGTVYVDRGRGGSARRAQTGMQAAADAGLPLVFFPEGTTSRGDTVLPFHRGLLAKSIEAGQPITAAYIRYRLTRKNGSNLSIENVHFWDDTPLPLHIFRLLALRGIEVEIRFATSPIAFSPAATNRTTAAQEARAAVLQLATVTHPGLTLP